MTRDVTDAEWAHFQEYARRVRVLYSRSEDQISPSVWIFFARRCPDGHSLIPRLQELDALDVSPAEPGRILLLSPTLRHLALTITHTSHRIAESSPIIDTVMELVQKISVPNLVGLRVTAATTDLPFNPDIMPYTRLAHLQELEILSSCLFDKDSLQALLAFPNLRKLTVNPKFLGDMAGDELTPGLHALLDLKIIGFPDVVSRFLQWTSPPTLESLAIDYIDWVLNPGVPETLPLKSATKTLRRLKISFASYLLPSSLLEVMRPILELDGMTHISITIDHLEMELPVTETELLTMADAWPNLVEFEIDVKEIDGGDDVLDYNGRPSPRSLITFAEHHPRLVRLVWPFVETFDASGIRDMQNAPALDHGLQVFRSCIVRDDGLPKHREFATFVDRLFPNLDLSDVQYPVLAKSHYGRQRFKRWCEVEQFLLAIHTGRQSRSRLT